MQNENLRKSDSDFDSSLLVCAVPAPHVSFNLHSIVVFSHFSYNIRLDIWDTHMHKNKSNSKYMEYFHNAGWVKIYYCV